MNQRLSEVLHANQSSHQRETRKFMFGAQVSHADAKKMSLPCSCVNPLLRLVWADVLPAFRTEGSERHVGYSFTKHE